MKKLTLLALALAFCAITLAGCSTACRPGNCGCIQGNLCGWQFYKPADMIEGNTTRNMDCCTPCQKQCCKPGVVVSRCYAVPAEKAPEVETPEEAAAVAADENVAEFAPPAEVR